MTVTKGRAIPIGPSATLTIGNETIVIHAQNWRHSATWTARFVEAVQQFPSVIQGIEKLDTATPDGLNDVFRRVQELVQKAPELVFDLVTLHRDLAPHRDHIDEHATLLDLVVALVEVVKLEFPLDKLRHLFSQLGQMGRTTPRNTSIAPGGLTATTPTMTPLA